MVTRPYRKPKPRALGTIKKTPSKKMISEFRKTNARGPRKDTHITAQASRRDARNTDRFTEPVRSITVPWHKAGNYRTKDQIKTNSSGKTGGQYSTVANSRPVGSRDASGFTGRRITGGGHSLERHVERSGSSGGSIGMNINRGDNTSPTRQKYRRTTYGPVDVAEPGNYGPTRASKRRQSQSFR